MGVFRRSQIKPLVSDDHLPKQKVFHEKRDARWDDARWGDARWDDRPTLVPARRFSRTLVEGRQSLVTMPIVRVPFPWTLSADTELLFPYGRGLCRPRNH